MANGDLQQPSRPQQVGNALLALSAGVAGRGPEFVQQAREAKLQEEQLRQTRDKERSKTVFLDAFAGQKLGSQGRWGAVAKLFNDRAERSKAHPGVDFRGTEQIRMMANIAASNNPNAAEAQENLLATFNNTVDVGRAVGVIKDDRPSDLDVASAELKRAQAKEATRKTELLGGEGLRAPEALLKDLSSATKAKASEAFVLAGGGKDGVKALNAQVALSNTQAQREDVPNLLNASFPNASPAERVQLDAAVQGAKTVESGMKQADKIRTEQRRLKKAKGFQERAVQLLNNILSSDQLGDITGSIEGGIDFRFSDVEAEVIADIQEAQNILTAENMDLMTGVLSESDIQLLKNLSSGALNRRRGIERFKKDATTLRDKLASKLVETVDGDEFACRE